MKKMVVLLLLLTVLLALSACDQEQLDSPSSSEPTSSQTLSKPNASTGGDTATQCTKHNFLEEFGVCSVCGIDYFSATLEFKLCETKDGYIVSDIGQCKATVIIIPETYNGLPVTEIGEYAFAAYMKDDPYKTKPRKKSFDITEVALPASLKRIDERAFSNCTSLNSIQIPEGVTHIGDAAFICCESLPEIIIPEGVTDIGKSAFSGCDSLKELTLPENVTSVGEAMLSSCRLLESITIPDSITVIPKNFAFHCVALKNVKLGQNVTRIEEDAFEMCTSLEAIELGNALEYIGKSAFSMCESLKSIALPETLKHIDGGAFFRCAFETVELPNSLESVGATYTSVSATTVFANCEQLQYNEYKGMGYLGSKENPYLMLVCRLDPTVTDVVTHEDTRIVELTVVKYEDVKSLYLGANVKQIPMNELWARRKPSKAIKLTLSPDNKKYHIAGNCIIETASKTLIWAGENPTIPDDGSVTVIGREAFSYDESVTCLIVPDCVEEIGINAFMYCNNLKVLVVGSGVKALGHDVLIQKEPICEVYYRGTPEQWEELKKLTNGFRLNAAFEDCTRYYYAETAPTEEGLYWHYVDGVPTPWKTEE